jgi:hypothetical protein
VRSSWNLPYPKEAGLMCDLAPIGMLFGSDSIEFEFDFTDNGVVQAAFRYQTFDMAGIFASNTSQNLQAAVVTSPLKIGEIPTGVTDAVSRPCPRR